MAKKKTDGAEKGGSWLDAWGNMAVKANEIVYDAEPMVSTGSLSLDVALRLGGLPRAAMVRIYGGKGTCKTTLCMLMAAQAIQRGTPILWIDAETSFKPHMAELNGIDTNSELLRIVRSDPAKDKLLTYEKMVRIIHAWLDDKEWIANGALFIIDSISSVLTANQLEGSVEDRHVASAASLTTAWMPRLIPLLVGTNSTAIFVHQMRADIGGMSYGPQEKPSGGFAINHAADINIRLQRSKALDHAEGYWVRFEVENNKFAYGGVEGRFPHVRSRGIDHEAEVLLFGEERKVITRSGAFYKWGDITLGQGVEKAREWLIEHPEERVQIEQQIIGRGEGS